MTYQNTNNVDFFCAYMLHVYEFLCIIYIQNIEANIQSKLISIHTCTCTCIHTCIHVYVYNIEACMPQTLN